jgi:chromate transport protein ChrA
MRNAALPITLIVVGVIGVVWHFGWFPNVESVTALALAAAGVLILATDRITKSSIVTGPMLIAVGGAIWLHDTYRIRWWLLMSVLLIIVGVLMLVARDPRIPEKRATEPTLPAGGTTPPASETTTPPSEPTPPRQP